MSTISSKNQITLPVQLLRALGLKPGDRLAVSQEDGKVILRPRPRDWANYYGGSLAGVYGDAEQVDAYLHELRHESDREADIERAWTGSRKSAPEE